MSKRKLPTFNTTISNIPCGILVTTYNVVHPWEGSAYSCPSDLDYYGYTEFEFIVLDRKGYVADWLQSKLTADDEARILKEYEET